MSAITVTITSTFGFVNSTGTIIGPKTYFQTIFDFQSSSTNFITVDSKILSINTLSTFNCFPNQYSDPQTVTFSNSGTAALTITSLLFTADEAIPKIDYGPGWGSIFTTIEPGTSKYFDLSYKGLNSFGDFYNSITIVSNNDSGPYRLVTQQNISYGFDWIYSPSYVNDSVIILGNPIETTFLVSPNQKSIDNNLLIESFGVTSSADSGWSVIDYSVLNGIGHISVRFDPDIVANVNGIYTQTLTVSVNGVTKTILNTATISLTTASYQHIVDWLSPVSPNNSVIGISYDLIDNKKTLTIGVGMGGDGTPVYDQGGSALLDINMLGIGANSLDYPYAHWAEVYRFTDLGTGTSQVLRSGLKDADGFYVYKVKETEGLNYGDYFGSLNNFGSMFLVNDDGISNLTITLTNIRETSGNQEFDDCLNNLSLAFYYYSEADTGSRIINLPQYPINPISSLIPSTGTVVAPTNEFRTRLFRGFVSSSTVTSLVAFPK